MNSAANFNPTPEADMANVSSPAVDNHHDRMVAAFAAVAPVGDWRDAIDANVEGDYLTDLGLTVADLIESVGYFTSTEAVASDAGHGLTRVQAVGYRMGPAGP